MTENEAGRPRPLPADRARRITGLAAVSLLRARPGPELAAILDADLIKACVAAVAVAERERALFHGPGRIDDDAARAVVLDLLDAEQRPFLIAAARAVPTTCIGHAIRAATFLLGDAGALHNEARLGSAADRLLAAIVHDLAAS